MKLSDDEVGDLKELVQSFGWKLLNKLLDEKKLNHFRLLQTAETMTDVRKNQSDIPAIEELLRFPRQKIQEAKNEEER